MLANRVAELVSDCDSQLLLHVAVSVVAVVAVVAVIAVVADVAIVAVVATLAVNLFTSHAGFCSKWRAEFYRVGFFQSTSWSG